MFLLLFWIQHDLCQQNYMRWDSDPTYGMYADRHTIRIRQPGSQSYTNTDTGDVENRKGGHR